MNRSQDPEDLLSAFAAVELHNPIPVEYAQHTLFFEYPACGLLPASQLPVLSTPVRAHFMDSPPLEKEMLGISDTTFWATFPIKPAVQEAILSSQPYLELLTEVEDSARAEGTTVIQLVTCINPADGALVWLFKLTRTDGNGRCVYVHELQLDECQFDKLIACKQHFSWIRPLQDLVTRNSYRAIYHVREKLIGYYGQDFASAEELGWRRSRGSAVASEFASAVMADVGETRLFSKTEEPWRALGGDVSNATNGEVSVWSMTAFRCLHAALDSLSSPSLVSPDMLSHRLQPLTKLVLERYERYIHLDCLLYEHSAKDMLRVWHAEALQCRPMSTSVRTIADVETPPGWLTFLEQWLTRTVNFIILRQCTDDEAGQEGIHSHGKALFYNRREWEPIGQGLGREESSNEWYEEEEDHAAIMGRTSTMEEVEEMMGNATLGWDS
ncbi:hypothetical protein LTR56_004486 [Elasticomyces elasticus]|nr:hypothetical protein LTR56_004486 [Elasticomyces elasticus]KAK3654220.1 hypothetical protein LTR22_010846 [Elasticomyces elasticus]KAK4920007.1 hypothetical protein LTR49_012445 [Elasticomyces elasticus]KAK5758841.1 hypothetical protein LTS12_011082 [Elasticomyces elasticus]